MTAKRKPPAAETDKWEFKARFRRHAFESQPASRRFGPSRRSTRTNLQARFSPTS